MIFKKKGISYTASISLDIYLASYLVDNIIYSFFFNRYNFNNLLQQEIIFYAPIILLLVFIFSFCFGVIRKSLIKVR